MDNTFGNLFFVGFLEEHKYVATGKDKSSWHYLVSGEYEGCVFSPVEYGTDIFTFRIKDTSFYLIRP